MARLILTDDEGTRLADWKLPAGIAPAEIERFFDVGFAKEGIDRCDECGAYVPRKDLVERHDPHGPEALCPVCSGPALEEV